MSTTAAAPSGTLPGVGAIAPTAPADVDAALAALRDGAEAWRASDLDARIALLDELIEATLAAAPAWALHAAEAKGIRRDSPAMGEDWLSGPVIVLRHLRQLRRTLADIDVTGRPQPPAIEVDPDGDVVVTVLPVDRVDRALFPGITAQVRLRPGVGLDDAVSRMGAASTPGAADAASGGVALVLGAGNVSAIAPLDVLDQVFAHGRACLLKTSPVIAHLGPHLAEAFEALVRERLLRIVYGGDDLGAQLVAHDAVDAVHLTGTTATYSSVVAARKDRAGTVTAELGSLTPVIVVPGPWTRRDLAYQGDHLASMLVRNAGFTCTAANHLVTHRSWTQRKHLLNALRDALRTAEERVPYHPGAVERWQRFAEAYPQSEWFGEEGPDRVPFTLIPELDPTRTGDLAFTTEPFCGVLCETALDTSRSVVDFVAEAVRFCNEVLHGSLAATILVHERSVADPTIAEAVERAVDGLRYGTVTVNVDPAVAFAAVTTPWGAHPDAGPRDLGMVHNSFLLPDVEKSVVRGPFRPTMRPLWLHTNRRMHRMAPAVAELVATQDARTVLPQLLWSLRP